MNWSGSTNRNCIDELELLELELRDDPELPDEPELADELEALDEPELPESNASAMAGFAGPDGTFRENHLAIASGLRLRLAAADERRRHPGGPGKD